MVSTGAAQVVTRTFEGKEEELGQFSGSFGYHQMSPLGVRYHLIYEAPLYHLFKVSICPSLAFRELTE